MRYQQQNNQLSAMMNLVEREKWQVPSFIEQLWTGAKHSWCVVIPVINEGQRIQNLLSRMAELNIAGMADIIIVDGGSNDGSLELDFLSEMGVSGLLRKTGPGKLSSQLRCAYAFALDQGYQGIVTIDGNDKDDPEAIPRFIDALKQGVDFVQASRFVPGGVAANTPLSRDIAIRVIHAPALSMSSGFHWTDTTQGFRAYSRAMLLDPAISPFRDEFVDYELLAYLSHRVPQMGYRCLELATSRKYPKGEVPTKISAVKGNLKVFKTLILACFGAYNAPGYSRVLLPPRWPIALLAILGLVISILAFFPGWLSPDSVAQYTDGREGYFRDWHPVLMAWWWSKLDQLYSGPALFLMQNLMLYWGGWGLIALAARRWFGRSAYLFMLCGFWPGLLFPMGQIWKDVAFACAVFFAWAVLINVYAQVRKPKVMERLLVFILGTFAFGIKTNGIVVLPFLYGFWMYLEIYKTRGLLKCWGVALLFVLATVLLNYSIVPQARILKTSPFQYTQTYDLLAISVKTGKNLLPAYVNQRLDSDSERLSSLYAAGGNNQLFYGPRGNMLTLDASELNDLNRKWLAALRAYPMMYLEHRLDNFKELMRWGAVHVAVVAYPGSVSNEYGFEFKGNEFSRWLSAQTDRHAWEFFPWIYILALIGSSVILICCKWHRVVVLPLSLSAVAFVLPHIVLAPSSDYRYLFYSYFCTVLLVSCACLYIARHVVSKILKMLK